MAGTVEWYDQELRRVAEARDACAPQSTSYHKLQAELRALVDDRTAALARAPRPPRHHAADFTREEYRQVLEAAAREATAEELEVFAAELLRRYGYAVAVDHEEGTIQLRRVNP